MNGSNDKPIASQQQSKIDKYNARVQDWIERTSDVPMSVREYLDGVAEVMRPQNIEMLEGMERMGWIAPRMERASAMQAAFCEFEFRLTPQSGWESFCYELDLIFVALPERTDERNIGHAALAQQIEGETERLELFEKRIIELTHNIDFHWGAMKSGTDVRQIWTGLKQARKALDDIAAGLRQSPQKPRWRERAQRKFRVGLATKLSTLFEREFGLEAKPVGGSASRPLEDTNDWTRFFQACAFLILGERVSPDRQAVLWEANGAR